MRKLAIISHTGHYYQSNDEIVGWEPTIREIDQLGNIFDIIYHIAPIHQGEPNQVNIKYKSKNIIFVPIRPTGGNGIIKKLGILYHMPYNLFVIIKILKKVNWIHFRAPTNLGIFVLPLLCLFPNKKKWIKYAGNWGQKKIVRSYLLQRWWLKYFQNSVVTINGKWEKQAQHLLSFENPCLTTEELTYAKKTGMKKDFSGSIKLCFIGRLSANKGLMKLIDALKNIKSFSSISEINIVGVNPEEVFDIIDNNIGITINILGWLCRKDVNEIYKNCHFIILPTESEGFPKVISEAASFGCIPIVTNISPINQYIINYKNGILLENPHISDIQDCIVEIQNNNVDFSKISLSAMELANLFTYQYYTDRIENEIIND